MHASLPVTPLEHLVGERTVPDLWHENYWFRRHEAAYVRLVPLLTAGAGPGDVLLEAGAGEGYGVPLLVAAGAGHVAALDYDAATTAHGAARYPAAGWARGNLARLPLVAGSVAAVANLQVIEHLWTPWEFLAECARVLRPGGPLLVTTPNRPTFSPGLERGAKPPNPYHVREYDAEELRELVARHLEVEDLLGVAHGERLRGWEAAHGGLVDAQLASAPEAWPDDLADLVRSVTAADFDVAPLPDLAAAGVPVLDLALLARAPRDTAAPRPARSATPAPAAPPAPAPAPGGDPTRRGAR